MRKIIVFPTKFAVIDIDYDKDDELYTARIRDVTEGLNAHVLPQQGKSIEEALNLMKISLETIIGSPLRLPRRLGRPAFAPHQNRNHRKRPSL